MRSSRLEPDEVRCSCGRLAAHANAVSYSSYLIRYIYRRCLCGREWTERLPTIDASRRGTWAAWATDRKAAWPCAWPSVDASLSTSTGVVWWSKQ